MDTFTLRLEEIQPSQLYISRTKYAAVIKFFEIGNESQLEPIPIKEIDGKLVSTDGHTRGVAWSLKGYQEIECIWEDLEMDWDEYRVYVQWCKEAGIESMHDLRDRFLDHDDYEVLWLGRCKDLQEKIELQRTTKLSADDFTRNNA